MSDSLKKENKKAAIVAQKRDRQNERRGKKLSKRLKELDGNPERTARLVQKRVHEVEMAKKARLWREKRERRRQLENSLNDIAVLQKPTKGYLPLDNAALIFPASENADKSNMFRLSALLYEDVDPMALQYAVNDVVPRFPGITGSLKKGAFWYYIEPSYKPVTIKKQYDFPCRKLGSDARNALFRVLYRGKELAVEFFHPATDGTGGLTFFNTLLKAYLLRRGYEIKGRDNALNTLDRPRPEETEDSYQRLYDKTVPKQNVDTPAYSIKGEVLHPSMLLLTTGIMDGAQVNAIAKKRGLTVGQLMASALIWAIEKDRHFRMDRDKKPVVVAMPVNLRKLFPSTTLRNFVGQIPVMGDGSMDFEQISASVKEQMSTLITTEYFTGFTTYNLKLQRNPLFKIIPRAIKTLAMKIVLKLKSNNVTTSNYSNLGKVIAPEEFKQHVVRYDFVIGPHKKADVLLSTICYNDVMVANVSRTIKENNVEKYFFRKLSDLGISVAIESNYEVGE